jgi:hypothetical protein
MKFLRTTVFLFSGVIPNSVYAIGDVPLIGETTDGYTAG